MTKIYPETQALTWYKKIYTIELFEEQLAVFQERS